MNQKTETAKSQLILQKTSPARGRLFEYALLLAFTFFIFTGTAAAQCVSLTTLGAASTQNFNTLSSTAGSTTNNLTITGWFLTEAGLGTRDNEQYAVDTGGSNTGDTYSYGAAGNGERALGGLQSGTLISTIGACFTNNTGAAITSLNIAYTGEQWRIGNTAAARDDRLDFQYSTNATSLSTGSWTDVDALDFTNPIKTATMASGLDGNAAANRTAISSAIPALSIANGATFWVRWNDLNATGADDGLAVDDFSITPNGAGGLPNLSISNVMQSEGDSGTTDFTFQVTLSSAAGLGGVTFDIATADGTAQDGNPFGEDNDYVAKVQTGQTISMGSTGPFLFTVSVNGDTTVEPNQTFFVNVTNVTGANVLDGQGQGTINNDDVAVTPIHDIQGPGASSPIVGATVTTRGIVTGVKNNGFFIQEPDATVDADPATSEGIFVFTGSTPPAAAAVGNRVQVTGTVTEFVPSADPLQPPLTEITSPTTTLLSSGNPLPTSIVLTTTFPDPAGPFDQLERLEGMRVSVSSLAVWGPTGGNVDEPSATASSNGVFFGTVLGNSRPFREPGIQAPDPPPSGSIPPIPRWDANPELLRVDSDGIGAAALDVSTSAIVTGLVGPLDYQERKYTILPDSTPSVAGGATATAAGTPASDEFTVASYNLERFYNTVDDPGGDTILTAAAYNARLDKASLGIRNYLHTPDIVGVVEVENLSTLQDLAVRINANAVAASQPNPQYVAYLVEGNDPGGIDVGFLVKTAPVAGSTPRVQVVEFQQELDGTLFVNPNSTTENLHDRPPLRLNAVVHFANGASFPVIVIANHLLALTNASSIAPGGNGWTTVGARARAKRQQQAEDIANLVQTRQTANPNERIMLLGDFNSFEFNDGLTDVTGIISGTPSADSETVVPGDGVDLVNPDLDNLLDARPPLEKYSFVFGGNAQSLDHIFVNQALVAEAVAVRLEHARINADFPQTARNSNGVERLSDHDPLIAYIEVSAPVLVPVPQPDSYETDEDTPLNVPAPGVLGNDTNAGGLNATLVTGPANAAAFTLNPNGSFSYTPAANFSGENTFTYKITGGQTDSNTATVTITVDPVNDQPTIAAGVISRQQAAGVSNSPVATVSDVEDAENTLSVTVNNMSSATVNGVTVSNLQVDANGNVTANVAAACGAQTAQFTLKVTDAGDLSATATLTVNVTPETTPPTINPIPNIVVQVPANSMATSLPVSFPLPTASDNCPGTVTVQTNPTSGSQFPLGTTTVQVTAIDAVGNQAMSSFTVTVNYSFSGFFAPVQNLPATNFITAGQVVDITFSLGGNQGLNVLASGYPVSSPIPCSATEPGMTLVPTVGFGRNAFTFNSLTNRYRYQWATSGAWAGTCRMFVLRLADGTEHYAKFQFQ